VDYLHFGGPSGILLWKSNVDGEEVEGRGGGGVIDVQNQYSHPPLLFLLSSLLYLLFTLDMSTLAHGVVFLWAGCTCVSNVHLQHLVLQLPERVVRN